MTKTRPKISAEHERFLSDQACTPDVLKAAGVRSLYEADDLPKNMRRNPGRDGYPGLLFPWRGYDGGELDQIRPDKAIQYPDGHEAKYVFPTGSTMILNVHPWMDDAVDDLALPLVIIEGTKQYLAAVAALGTSPEYALVGMPGCYGWKQHKVPLPDVRAMAEVIKGRDVILCFDADYKHNPLVYDAAKKLTGLLSAVHGAKSIRYVSCPEVNSKTDGLDDVLSYSDEKRDTLLRLFTNTDARLPASRPSGVVATDYVEASGKVIRAKVVDKILEDYYLALGPDGRIAVYEDGVYRLWTTNDPSRSSSYIIGKAIKDLIGNAFSRTNRDDLIAGIQVELADQGHVLPLDPISPWLNLTNGMLDLATLELHDHHPKYYSITQLPVEWDPKATCPVYDAWLDDVAGDQADLLHEVAAQMLTPHGTPTKGAFLFGPSRSGKSTCLRIWRRLVGDGNTASETLHALSSTRWATASLFGKVLNTAADLSAKKIGDLSTFKMLTGDDVISAEFKGMQKFSFVNRAVLAFSSNNPPTVDEATNAYRVRLAKIAFDVSYEGAEDPTIEARILAFELPGVLVRMALAGQAKSARGGAWSPERASATAAFEQYSDAVARWLSEEKTIVTHTPADISAPGGEPEIIATGQYVSRKLCSTITDLHAEFKEWAADNHEDQVGKITLGKRLASIDGVVEVRMERGVRALNIVDKIDDVDHDSPSSSTPSTGSVGRVGRVEEIQSSVSEKESKEGDQLEENGNSRDGSETNSASACDHENEPDADAPLPIIPADFDLLHQWVYDAIVAKGGKVAESHIRTSLRISATEYESARDHLLRVGVIARRLTATGGRARGFDVVGELVYEAPPYVPIAPEDWGFTRESSFDIFAGVPIRPCIACGKTNHTQTGFLPQCDACLVPYAPREEA